MFPQVMKVRYSPADGKESARMGLKLENTYDAYDIVDERILIVDDNQEFVWVDLHKFKVVPNDSRKIARVENSSGDKGLLQGTKQISNADATIARANGKAVSGKDKHTEPVGSAMDFTKALS